ncbi:uncharacterized protein LOC144110296 isoform X2 [Amblyomma americanum]
MPAMEAPGSSGCCSGIAMARPQKRQKRGNYKEYLNPGAKFQLPKSTHYWRKNRQQERGELSAADNVDSKLQSPPENIEEQAQRTKKAANSHSLPVTVNTPRREAHSVQRYRTPVLLASRMQTMDVMITWNTMPRVGAQARAQMMLHLAVFSEILCHPNWQ